MPNRYLLWDVAVVALFVVLGRRTHQETESLQATLETAAPFMFALAAGWVAAALRAAPASLRGGLIAAPITIAGGIVLRRFVAEDGIALPFIIVTSLFLASTMLGWRLVAVWLARRAQRIKTTREPATHREQAG